MKVILKEDIPKLGNKGDLKDVAPGYARNHLIPRSLAVEATPQRLREWQQRQEKEKRINQQQEGEARALAEKIAQAELVFNMPAGDGGRLFGSVTAADIALKLSEAGFSVDKKKLDLPEPIKSVGTYKVFVRLYPGVKADLTLRVDKED
jgi:large subunit ribosomal protein L9